jgi:hypothetical protein
LVILETVKARLRADAETGPRNVASLAACDVPSTAHLESDQGDLASRGPSADASATARDLVFEGLVETGSPAESYSRSPSEAAWRGDRSTVEVHLRQLRACVVTSIGIFKQLGAVEAKDGRA